MIPHGRVLILEGDAERASQVAQLLTFLGYEPWPASDAAATGTDRGNKAQDNPLATIGWSAVVVGDLSASDKTRLQAIVAATPGLPVLDAQDFSTPATGNASKRRRASRTPLAPTGASKAARQLAQLVGQVAPSNATVLILGESGTGKERVARSVHAQSTRRDRPFVPLNCGAIPSELMESELFGHEKGAFTGAVSARKGRFEMAEGGTLFLDEIGDMSLELQVKLLRVLQERSFERLGGSSTINSDVRILAATHRDLKAAVADGRFREDLYYRLSVFPIEVPALRERIEDLPSLVHELVEENVRAGGARVHFSEQTLRALAWLDWPGNIRELANLVERMAILKAETIVEIDDLPVDYRVDLPAAERSSTQSAVGNEDVDLKDHLQQVERELIEQALERSQGVVAEAARLLNVGRTTLVEKIRKYGLNSDSDRVA